MPGELSRAAAIVGAAEANEIGYPKTPKTALQLHMEAIKNVSNQTGIPISRINGVFGAGAVLYSEAATNGPRKFFRVGSP